MYIVLALVMLLRGFVDAIMMRAQQAMALNSEGYLPPEHFDQISQLTRHDHDLLHGHAVHDRAPEHHGAAADRHARRGLPFLNSLSLWLAASGAGLVMVSLVIGKFSTGGWTRYPPCSASSTADVGSNT